MSPGTDKAARTSFSIEEFRSSIPELLAASRNYMRNRVRAAGALLRHVGGMDADDVSQLVAISLLTLDQPPSDPPAYLRRCARNIVASKVRYVTVRGARSGPEPIHEPISYEDPVEKAAANERFQLVLERDHEAAHAEALLADIG